MSFCSIGKDEVVSRSCREMLPTFIGEVIRERKRGAKESGERGLEHLDLRGGMILGDRDVREGAPRGD